MIQQVVVTGIGLISSAGIGKEAFWSSLYSGNSGIQPLNYENYPKYIANEQECKLAALMPDFEPTQYFSRRDCSTFDTSCLMILKAVDEALADASFTGENINTAVILGTAIGFRPPYKRLMNSLTAYSKGDASLIPAPHYYESFSTEYLNQTPIEAVYKKYALQGSGLSMSSICASGSTAICLATELVKQGQVDAVVCGAYDFFHPLQNRVFSHYKMLASDFCRPFDKTRTGFQLGEGIGIVIVESLENARRRDAKIYAEISGFGMANEAFHLVIPSPSGAEYSRCISTAIIDSKIDPDSINYFCPVGRGGKDSDAQEVRGIEKAFGKHANSLFVNSIVPITGYCLGANSVFNFIATLLQMKNNTIYSIKNFIAADNKFKLNFVKEPVSNIKVENAVVCGYGFTGATTAIVLNNGMNME